MNARDLDDLARAEMVGQRIADVKFSEERLTIKLDNGRSLNVFASMKDREARLITYTEVTKT